MARYANKSQYSKNSILVTKYGYQQNNLSPEDDSGSRKLYPKICCPFKILERPAGFTYRLELSEPMKARKIHDVFHTSLVKPYHEY